MPRLNPRSILIAMACVAAHVAFAAGGDARQLAAAATGGDAAALAKLQASAGSGNLDAQYWLAMYDLQVRHDDMQAAHWLQHAAERGSVPSQYSLGLLYTQGRGVPRDYATAADWYRKAAAHGDLNAANNLGWLYSHGDASLPADPAKAADWYRKAAQAGNAQAQNNLGWLYVNGTGVARDMTLARHWLELAAKGGDAQARTRLDALNGQVTAAPPAPVAIAPVPRPQPAPPPATGMSPAADAQAGTDGPAQAVQAWAQAWSTKNLPAYFAAYVPDFQPSPGVSHAAWVADRTARIAGKAAISVTLGNVQAKVAGTQATVSFHEDYRAGAVHFAGGKALVLQQVGGRWLIARER